MSNTFPTTRIDVARLVEEHQVGVWRYLRALGCETALAEDITQDTFLAVLEKPFDYLSPAATGAYLRRIAHNLFVSAQRRAGRVHLVEDFDYFERIWEQWVRDDDGDLLVDALKDCLKRLTPRARLSLEMRFGENGSRKQIADKLQITEHGAKNLMQRAKKQLRDCVNEKVPLK